MIRLLCLLLLLAPAVGSAATWKLEPETTISADVDWQGKTVVLRFPQLSGDIDFDADHPERARAAITVSARSATTGVPVVDSLVRSRDYLDANAYPAITFRLDKLTQTSKSSADVQGRITLRGVTKPVSLHAQVFAYGPAKDDPSRFEAGFNLTGQIDRTEFGSTGGLPQVSAVLPIHIRLLMSSR